MTDDEIEEVISEKEESEKEESEKGILSMLEKESDDTSKDDTEDTKKGGSILDKLKDSAKDMQIPDAKADVVFVFDCTGSMGNEIDAVKETIVTFADIFEKEKVKLRLGLVEFRDLTEGEEVNAHMFSSGTFTRSAAEFKSAISGLVATGGGVEPESSFEAIVEACRMDWGDGQRVILLITDAPPHTKSGTGTLGGGKFDSADVSAELDEAGIGQIYFLNHPSHPAHQPYKEIVGRRENGFFDLGKKDKKHLISTLVMIGKTTSMKTKTLGKTKTMTKTE